MLGQRLVWIVFFAGVPAFAGETGSIVGSVDKPQQVTGVCAVNRENDKKFTGKLDPKSGQFRIDGLPLNGRYDCVIDIAGARLEGVNLRVPASDYEEEQPLPKEDIETIKTKVRNLNKFEDVIDILTVTGNVQHAAVLVNKLRTKPFYESKPGEVVWRAELWRFERPEETWVKVQDELFLTLYRERLQKKEYIKKSITFDPALGGLEVTRIKLVADLKQVKLPGAAPGIRLRDRKAGASAISK